MKTTYQYHSWHVADEVGSRQNLDTVHMLLQTAAAEAEEESEVCPWVTQGEKFFLILSETWLCKIIKIVIPLIK